MTKQEACKKHGLFRCIILAAFAVLPFMISFGTNENEIYSFVYNRDSFHLEMEKCAVLFFGLVFLIREASVFRNRNKRDVITAVGLGVFFGLCTLLGKSFSDTDSWDYVFGSFYAFFGAALVIAGYAIVFYYFISAALYFIREYERVAKENLWLKKLNTRLENFLQSKALLKLWLILALCWLPYILLKYPAAIHADSGVMLSEYESGNLFNHHPVVQTIIWGSFLKAVAGITGSWNVGVFLYALIQCIYGTFIMALLFDTLIKIDCPRPIAFIAFLIVALSPACARYAVSVCKDSNYTLFVMLMVWLIIKTLDIKGEFNIKRNWQLLVLWTAVVLLVSFSRKGGIYSVFVSVAAVLIYLFIQKNIRLLAAVALAAVVGVVGYYGGQAYIENVCNIGNDDAQETYSIPFQQTARYVKTFGDEVTQEERDAIDAVLDYNALAEKYNPQLSDPVKSTYKADCTGQEFSSYLGIWLSMFLKHPGTYIQATMNNTYGYFYPENAGYYPDVYFETQCVDETRIFTPDWLKGISKAVTDWNMHSRNYPVIGLFLSVGFYVWLDIFVMVYFLCFKKDMRAFIYNLPALVTLLMCIASPANNTMRYALVIIFSAPLMACLCFQRNKTE